MKLDKVQVAAISSMYTTIFLGAIFLPLIWDTNEESYKRGRRDGAEIMAKLWKIEYDVRNGNITGKEEP